jgi:hypothetical protein
MTKVFLLKLAQEGGVSSMNYLLARAVPPHDALPSELDVHEWIFHDILRLPVTQQKEWKIACHEELESLHAQKVFELVKLPPGRKAIKNRWVFWMVERKHNL